MTNTFITIIRHGETEWNKLLRLQGHTNTSLTPLGIYQAEKLSDALKKRKFDVCYSSDLDRALQTVKIILRKNDIKNFQDANLRERSFGILEGLTYKQIEIKHPHIYKEFAESKKINSIPGGESLDDFNKRIIRCILSIEKKESGKQILIVAHGGILDCILRQTLNLNLDGPRNFSMHNTSINSISIRDEQWFLEEWGNIEHLKKTTSRNAIG